MFDMGWWELSVIGMITILVLGPKELPYAMKSVARFMRKARRLASDFQGHMDDLIQEADLDEVQKTVRSIRNKDIGGVIEGALDPSGEVKSELESTMASAQNEVDNIKAVAKEDPNISCDASEASQDEELLSSEDPDNDQNKDQKITNLETTIKA